MQRRYIAATTHIITCDALANAVIDKDTGGFIEYVALASGPDKDIWIQALANDIGRLAQGIGSCIKGNNAMFFIHSSKIPTGRKITYGYLVPTLYPNKNEVNRNCLIVGGDRLKHEGNTTTRMASLTTNKYLFNSILSI